MLVNQSCEGKTSVGEAANLCSDLMNDRMTMIGGAARSVLPEIGLNWTGAAQLGTFSDGIASRVASAVTTSGSEDGLLANGSAWGTVGIAPPLLLGEIDWIRLIVYSGITIGVGVIGVYLIMLVKDWMESPQEYSSTGDDLESLREALKLGSIDEDEYRRAVQAMKTLNERLAPRTASGSLKSELVEERITAASFVEVKPETTAGEEPSASESDEKQ